MTNRYIKAKQSRAAKGDNNNCSVIAISIVCRVSYVRAHKACEYQGRKKGHGQHSSVTRAIIKDHFHCELTPVLNRNGKPLRQKNGSKYTPKTIGKRCKSGYFLVSVDGHIFAVVNGQVEDWTNNRNHHITSVYRVTVPKGSRS